MNSKSFRGYILAGLVVWLPVLMTFVVLRFIVEILDSIFALLPDAYQPDKILGIHLPGLGVLLSLILLIITGIVATNMIGQHLLQLGEWILAKIPLVRSIYYGAQQIIQAIFASNSQAFRKVMLIEYPRAGIWSLAFLTGSTNDEVISHVGSEMLSVFIPTTPIPTSGFMLLVPKENVIELSMTVEEAMKYIISMGVVSQAKPMKKT